MHRSLCLCGALLSLTLMACAAPEPPRTYTLMAAPAVSTPVVAGEMRAFELLPVRVPAQADLPQVVMRRADGELRVLEHHRWAAPLPEELRSALSLALSDRLGRPDVHRIARPELLLADRIQVELRRFESREGGGAVWHAVWAVRPPEGAPLLCDARHEAEAVPGVAGLIEAHQALVGRLADALVTVLKVPPAERRCP